jgi:hypothetical protein
VATESTRHAPVCTKALAQSSSKEFGVPDSEKAIGSEHEDKLIVMRIYQCQQSVMHLCSMIYHIYSSSSLSLCHCPVCIVLITPHLEYVACVELEEELPPHDGNYVDSD